MLKRPLLIIVELGFVCIAFIAVALLWASYYIDTTEFRDTFTSYIQELSGRDVHLNGDIDIALWPGLVLDVEDLSISEDVEFGGGQFAHFDRIRISIRLLPLLSEALDIKTIIVEGMELSIVHNSDGLYNWQSIQENYTAGSKDSISSDFTLKQITLTGLEIINASVTYKEGMEDQGYVLSGINLRTGLIEIGENIPFTVSSRFSWIDGGVESDLTLKGRVEPGFDGSSIALNDATLYASVGGAFLPEKVKPGELTARVVVDWDNRSVALDGLRMRFEHLMAEGYFKTEDLRKGLSAQGHITVHPFDPASLITRYLPQAPVDKVSGLKSSAFASFFSLNESGLSLKDFALTLDDMTVRGDIGFKGYSWPVFSFGLRADTVDLDRYLPLFKTDTPFFWEDFNLHLFSQFRGEGAIRLDGFKVLDTLISDIRLTVKADKKSILIDAGAIKNGQASLGGKTEITIGKNNDGVPVLALSAHVTAESQKNGFAFLQTAPISISGVGAIDAKVVIKQMACPSDARSIDILRHLEGNASLSLGAGKSFSQNESSQKLLLDYTKADISLAAKPVKNVVEGYYKYNLAVDVKTQGGKDIQSLAVTAQGPLTTAIDTVHVKSSGMDVSGYLTSLQLPKDARRVTASGLVGFDSKLSNLSIKNAQVRILETPIKGSATISGLDQDITGSGQFEFDDINPKRIVYLLNNYSIRTKDVEALKKAAIEGHFTVRKNGFALNKVEGRLDGMSFNGHVVGKGLKEPKLSFSFSAGEFDLDRYLPPSPNVSLEERRAGKEKKAPPVELPLDFLRSLQLNGSGFFEEFKLANVRAKSISVNIKADKGSIHISDVKGKIHSGQLTSDWRGEVGKDELTTALKLHVEDMQLGPLLQDMATRDYVRGETDVDFDLNSRGATDDDILKNLSGKAWARITNGSFKFSNYDNKQSASGSNVDILKRTETVTPRPRTVFQKALGNFTVSNGVFTADKIRIEAPPLLQAYGKGSFSLPDNSMNISVRNDFVAVPSVTVQLTGKLTDPEMHIPKGKIINDTVRNILSLPEKSFNFFRDLFN